MKHYVGLDISMKETSLCIVNEKGDVIKEVDLETEPKVIAAYLKSLNFVIDLVGLESGSLSHWMTEQLLDEGLCVKCIDARHCASFLSMRVNKTDRNDARGIAEVMRCNVYREVAVKSKSLREKASLLTARKRLVEQRTQIILTIRGMIKAYGLRLGSISKTENGFKKLKETLEKNCLEANLLLAVEQLINTGKTLANGILILDKEIEQIVKDSKHGQLLMSIPGVGPITALRYLVEISKPERFKKSRSVGAYLGLTPRQYSSGELHKMGRISKCGSKEMRSLLVEAAIVLLTRTKSWSKLKAWGLKLYRKKGLKKAATAVARKLAVIMHTMLITEKTFLHGEAKQKIA